MESKKEIFREILYSANTNCVLKIKLKRSNSLLITAVDRISKNEIILKPTCLYGYKIKQQKITLLEIDSVTRYHANFYHPLFVKLRYVKDNITALRQNVKSLKPEIA